MNDPEVLERLAAFLPPGSVPSTSPVVRDLYSLIVGSNVQGSKVRRYNLLYAGSVLLARTMDLGDILEALEGHMHLLVAVRAPRRLFVRAGVVGWGGSAIVLPGDHSADRDISALVAKLVRAGAAYYSDKYAVLDERGRVHPYLTPLFKEDGRRPLPVGVIAFPASEPGTLSGPRALSPGQAVLALLGHTIASRLRPAYALKVLERAVSGATTLELHRETADGGLESLLDRPGISPRPLAC